MVRTTLLALVTLTGVPLLRAQSPSTPLVGSWTLRSRMDRDGNRVLPADGPLGSDPIGLLIYDGQQHVATQLMARRRDSSTAVVAPQAPQDPNNSAASGGYDAYFGRYEVDTVTGTVTHILEGALSPADVGRRLSRHFRLHEDSLTIWFEARRADGRPVQRTLVWIRSGPVR